MSNPYPATPEWHQDRRSSLYASMAVFLVLNNLAVVARCVARYRARKHIRSCIYLEDAFIIIGGILINAVVGNLLASTHYGLGLHATRIVSKGDVQGASNMSKVFRHVWISMVLFSPTYTAIKVALLFFYRRVFLVHQKWLRIAWWANLIYLMFWVVGATGFYLFQCWPVNWYYMRYYAKNSVPVPGGESGQCNATSTQHVAMPVIFGLISDVAVLCLPIVAVLKLQIDKKKKVAIAGIFSIGILACCLGLARLVELEADTDDKTDPSYGVVIFLILSAAEAVCAIVCASLPVVGPQIFQKYKAGHPPQQKRSTPGNSSYNATASHISKGFHKLGGPSGDLSDEDHLHSQDDGFPLNSVDVEAPAQAHAMHSNGDKIVVKSEVHVTRGSEQGLEGV